MSFVYSLWSFGSLAFFLCAMVMVWVLCTSSSSLRDYLRRILDGPRNGFHFREVMPLFVALVFIAMVKGMVLFT